MTKHSNLLPRNALGIVCASLVLAGCGLKGDLYLEEPDTAAEQQVETGDVATGTETSSDQKKSDWVERLELEKEKRSESSTDTAAATTATPAAAEQPEILTKQDELQNAQKKSEKEIGVPALEYSTPADDTTDGSTTEDGNSTP
jgi:predicted small lipoprotein YifL